MWTPLIAMVIKEVRQTVRDTRMMLLIVGAPLVQLVLFGYAVNLDVDRVPTVIVDHDDSRETRTHTRRILADGTLVEVGRTTREREAWRALEAGEASVVLLYPPGFQKDVVRGREAIVQAVVDGTDPNRSGVARGAIAGYFAESAAELRRARRRELGFTVPRLDRIPRISLAPRVYYNPSLETAVFMVPGVAAILLMLITTVVTAMGIAREREMGTLEQVLVTPMPSWVVIVGKLLPFLGIGLIDFGLAMAVGAWLFDMPIRGGLPLLFAATLLYLMTTLGVGLLISALSRSQQQAFIGGFVFMLPAILLSGTLTPVHSMPRWMQIVTLANPVRYYVEALRATLLEAATVRDLWMHLLVLAAFGLAIVGIASKRFRKTLR